MKFIAETIELPAVVRSYSPLEIVALFVEKAAESESWTKRKIDQVVYVATTHGIHYFIETIDRYVDWVEFDYDYDIGQHLDESSNHGLSDKHYGYVD